MIVPIHPGEILREEFFLPRGMRLTTVSVRSGIEISALCRIMQCERPITIPIAYKLAEYYGTTPRFWINLQLEYDISLYEKENGIKPAEIPIEKGQDNGR